MDEQDSDERSGRLRVTFLAARHALLRRTREAGPRPNVDVVSVLTLTAALMLSTVFGLLEVSWFHTDTLAARVSDMNADSAHDRSEERESEHALLDCVLDVGAVARVRACDTQARKAWVFGAPNKVRKAMGQPLCWWHASAVELAEIRGIQISYAMLAVKVRDHVDGLRHPLELAEDVGARRAQLLSEGSTTRCALDAR